MPLYDDYGQQVPYATLSDPPNAQTLSQGIVDGVVPRSIMRFASASTRGATLSNPVAGMVTYLGDVGRLEVYDGSRWVSFATGASSWETFPLHSDWAHGWDEQPPLQYRLVSMFGGSAITFRGAIHRDANYPSSMPFTFTISSQNLPTEVRPDSLRVFNVTCSASQSAQTSVRMAVHANGEVSLSTFSDSVRPPWITFDNTLVAL